MTTASGAAGLVDRAAIFKHFNQNEEIDRERLISELVTGASSGGDRRPSSFWLLTGERGIGKTFIGQEAYRRLAAVQKSPPFWPPSLLDESRENLEGDRHRTRPRRIQVPPESTPSFAWIGINCAPAVDGIGFDVLGSATSQVRQMQSAIETALHAGREGRSKQVLLDLLEIATAFLSLVPDPTAQAIGMAFTARSAADAYSAITASRAERTAIRAANGEGMELDAERPDEATVSNYQQLLRALTDRVGLPTVLFLDDLQHADPTLLGLLSTLPTEVPQNLTVLGTADSAALDSDRPEDHHLTDWLETGGAPDFVRVPLGGMEDSTLSEIVTARAPRTPRETVSAFVHRSDSNPYRLRLLLDAPSATPVDDAITVEPREVMSFPNPFEALYRQAWLALSSGARRIAAVAAMQGQAIERSLLDRTCRELGIERFDALLDEVRRRQWLVPKDEATLVFPDESRQAVAIAESAGADTLSAPERSRAGRVALAAAIAALNGSLATWTQAESAPPELPGNVLANLEAVAVLGQDHVSAAPDDVARFTLVFADILSRARPITAAEHLAGVAAQLRAESGELAISLELQAAECWSDGGELDRSLACLEQLKRQGDPQALSERALARRLAFTEGKALIRKGRLDLAIPLLSSLAEDKEDEDGLGFSSSTFLISAGGPITAANEFLRKFIVNAADPGDGIPWWRDEEHCTALRELIERHDLKRVNAARVANARARGQFAYHLGDKAKAEYGMLLWHAALAMYDDLVAGLEVTAPDDSHLIVTVDFRAVLLSKCGAPAQALIEHDRALALHARSPRDDRPNLLITRGNRAQTLSRLGRHEEALEALEGVYDEQARLLGQEHPATLQTRVGRARVLARAGVPAAAMNALIEATEEHIRALGPEHPDSQELALTVVAMQSDPPAIAIEDFGAEKRPGEFVELDELRKATYLQTQAEDWELLFGTASPSLYLERTAMERVLRDASREALSEQEIELS
jgi:tetratricopeptide (TPR) repeat protein